jgi:DNA-binding MarR family transcriptional regulator
MQNDKQQPDALALAEVEETCLCFNVRKIARAMTQQYDILLQPSGLRATQFNVLVAIGLAGKVPLTRLAEILAMDRTTLAHNLKPLSSQDLVTIETGTEDRRVRVIKLTEHGCRVLHTALPRWQQAQQQMISQLGVSLSQTLLTDLKTAMELL